MWRVDGIKGVDVFPGIFTYFLKFIMEELEFVVGVSKRYACDFETIGKSL